MTNEDDKNFVKAIVCLILSLGGGICVLVFALLSVNARFMPACLIPIAIVAFVAVWAIGDGVKR